MFLIDTVESMVPTFSLLDPLTKQPNNKTTSPALAHQARFPSKQICKKKKNPFLFFDNEFAISLAIVWIMPAQFFRAGISLKYNHCHN
jgi:hypothetical protein